MRKLSRIGIQQYTNHEAFLTMLLSSLQDNSKNEPFEILEYWFEVAFSTGITEEDLDENIIDRIRKQLLIKGGISKPILKETSRVEKIKQLIEFE